MSDYTPSEGRMLAAWLMAMGVSRMHGDRRERARAEFDRFIAKVKADAVRGARDSVRASSFWNDGSDNYADRVRGYLSAHADRIERGER